MLTSDLCTEMRRNSTKKRIPNLGCRILYPRCEHSIHMLCFYTLFYCFHLKLQWQWYYYSLTRRNTIQIFLGWCLDLIDRFERKNDRMTAVWFPWSFSEQVIIFLSIFKKVEIMALILATDYIINSSTTKILHSTISGMRTDNIFLIIGFCQSISLINQ